MPITLAVTMTFVLAAQAPAGAVDPLRETVRGIRDTGVAMVRWIDDSKLPLGGGHDSAGREYDWSKCPPISHQQLVALLVPKYAESVPEQDGWGHPLEFCLDRRSDGYPDYAAGIRSAGSDARFEGERYAVGPFLPAETERDLVWFDGYFVAWPQANATEP